MALLVALAAAGALSVATPARGPAFAPPNTVVPHVVSAQLDDLLESAPLASSRGEQGGVNLTAAGGCGLTITVQRKGRR